MSDIFKPEDFLFENYNLNVQAAEWASKKLNTLIESWPVVYVKHTGIDYRAGELPWHDKSETHKARLAFIEELKKEDCKHSPNANVLNIKNNNIVITSFCQHCGIELTATWSPK